MCLLLEAAWHTTKLEARYRAQGNVVDAERAHERTMAVVHHMANPAKSFELLAGRLAR